MSDHDFTCPGCGRTYICDQDDQDPSCCNREALSAEIERLRTALKDAVRPEVREGLELMRLRSEIKRLRTAIDIAYDMSTWAACINWRARDKDNTADWLDELREKIEATQAAISAARGMSASPKCDGDK